MAQQKPRPILYLDIMGTVVLAQGQSNRLAPFAKDFVKALKNDFEVRFLSEVSEEEAKEVSRRLGASIGYAPWRHAIGKYTGIDFSRPFIWVDDAPSARDIMKLSEERCSDRLVNVSGREGVTDDTLRLVRTRLSELFSSNA